MCLSLQGLFSKGTEDEDSWAEEQIRKALGTTALQAHAPPMNAAQFESGGMDTFPPAAAAAAAGSAAAAHAVDTSSADAAVINAAGLAVLKSLREACQRLQASCTKGKLQSPPECVAEAD